MNANMHRLLKRQIKQFLGADASIPEDWRPFFQAVEDSYYAAEKERQLLERTLDLNSKELTAVNAQLRQDLQDRKRIEDALRYSERKTRLIIDTAQDAVISVDDAGRITDWNRAAETIFGWQREEALGRPMDELVIPARHRHSPTLGLAQHMERGRAQLGKVRVELVGLHRDGHEFPMELALSAIESNGAHLFHIFLRDISERKRAEESLFQEKELAQVTLQSIADGVITTDAWGRITYLNPVAEQITNWTSDEALGQAAVQVFNVMSDTTGTPAGDLIEICLQRGKVVDFSKDTVLVNRQGQALSIESSVAPIRNRGGLVIGAVLVFRDVSQARKLESQISWQANHDALTGLFNRTAFEQKLTQLVASTKAEKQHHALCYLDLDQFKVVNDHCGHMAGDELLRQLSMLLGHRVREADTLARLGGDEFGLILANCPIEMAQQISEEMCRVVREFRFVWQEKIFSVGVSIGLVEINAESESVEKLQSAADAACYAAKERGRNRVQLYKPDDTNFIKLHGEMQWVTRIHKAFDENRFRLYCQPIVPLHDGAEAEAHYEVLLRLTDAEGRLIPPISFIPAAERYQLMGTIDRWVLTTLFAAVSDPRAVLARNNVYSVNLSGQSLNDDHFLDFVLQLLDANHLPAAQLCFEITETAAITNLTKAVHFMNTVRERGCRFSLDDFGSGLSSFGYLKNLPVNFLKIDGEFVRDIAVDPIDHAMVEAINNIGHLMGLRTIAEFVESQAIVDKLKGLGIDYAQGYFCGRPTPLSELALRQACNL